MIPILGIRFHSILLIGYRGVYRNLHSSVAVSSEAGAVFSSNQTKNNPLLTTEPKGDASNKINKISTAMRAYLERSKKHDDFMKEKREEYELGKRHLANIMGWNPETITQEDIDEAIRYLLPSGLFEPTARPMMKPPEEIYPKQKAAMFDVEGRPFSSFFYTSKPQYYEYLHQIHEAFLKLNQFEDSMLTQGILTAPKEATVDLVGSSWLSHDDYVRLVMEQVTQPEYDYMITTLERLAKHPYSARVKDLFMKYRRKMISVTSQIEVPPLTIDEATGRPYVEAEGFRKHCVAKVKVWANGTGKVNINGKDLSYFDWLKEREQVMAPLQFTGLLFKVDLEAKVWSTLPKGPVFDHSVSAEAGAIRHGLSLALRSFVDSEMVEEMRLAGLLTKDRRIRERKKYGQWKARKKFTWKKR